MSVLSIESSGQESDVESTCSQLLALQKEGKIRHIGVSNFGVRFFLCR